MTLQRLQEDYLRTRRINENPYQENEPTPCPEAMYEYLADNCKHCEALKDSLISLTCPEHTYPTIMGVRV